MGATQIARETGLNVSSAFNILRTLSQEGLLSFDTQSKTYSIGIGLLELSAPLLCANPADAIRPVIDEIAHKHDVAIALYSITSKGRIVLTDSVSPGHIIRAVIPMGSRFPIFAGGIGRCYIARLDLDKDTARAGYETVRWQNPPGFESYWSDAAAAKDTRYARDRGQLTRGIEIVSSLVLDTEQTPRIGMSSLTLAGQNDEESLEQVGQELAVASGRIDRALFAKAPL